MNAGQWALVYLAIGITVMMPRWPGGKWFYHQLRQIRDAAVLCINEGRVLPQDSLAHVLIHTVCTLAALIFGLLAVLVVALLWPRWLYRWAFRAVSAP